jgi:hypothetical protein
VEKEQRKGQQVILGDAVKRYMRTSGISARESAGAIFSAWNDAAEALLGTRVPAVRFKGGELVAETASSAQLQELKSFQGEELRREANRRLGGEKISRVSFRIGNPS